MKIGNKEDERSIVTSFMAGCHMDTTDKKTSRSCVEAGTPFLHMCGLELDVEG